VIVASAAAAASQPAPPQRAGDKYKSVRILGDMPATLMIPTMAFIANSLGVTCLHCHTDVYESDEKPTKQKARDMILLTRAINDRHFGGQNAVTCETCHNGRAVPATIPSIEHAGWNKAPVVPSPPPPDLAVVIQRFSAAVGVDALRRLASQRITGTITRMNGRTPPASGPFEVVQEQPRTFTLNTQLSHPPEADAELPVTFLRPLLLTDTYPDLRVTGRGTVNGAAAVEVTGTRAGTKTTHRLYFSDETGLLLRRADEIDTPLGPVPEQYTFADFRTVDGIAVPMRIVWSRADYQVTFVVDDVRHAAR
jgi:hypothetical protein